MKCLSSCFLLCAIVLSFSGCSNVERYVAKLHAMKPYQKMLEDGYITTAEFRRYERMIDEDPYLRLVVNKPEELERLRNLKLPRVEFMEPQTRISGKPVLKSSLPDIRFSAPRMGDPKPVIEAELPNVRFSVPKPSPSGQRGPLIRASGPKSISVEHDEIGPRVRIRFE